MSNRIAPTRFLVTGGAGFIGGHLAERLLADGHSVCVLDDFSTGRRENVPAGVELIEGSLTDPEVCRTAARGAEFVLHEAAIPSVPRSVADPVRSHAANATGTLNLLEACRAGRVRRVVYAASSSAYGNAAAERKDESLCPEPLSPYAVAKLAGEHYLHAYHHVYGLETVSLRYFNVFGPRQDPASDYAAVIPRFITRMLRGERPVIFGDGGHSRDFTYISNNVEANLLACTAADAPGRCFNIACGESFSLLDLVGMLNEIMGTEITPVHEPPRAGDVRHSLADITLARECLGYEVLVNFRDGLKRTVDWYRSRAA
ncbi:SDR family oxidoreductase [Candidatus Poribacteria bacterium]|nr:SDR family oxidoreductase [Candidatus Poribacteria bacterium]